MNPNEPAFPQTYAVGAAGDLYEPESEGLTKKELFVKDIFCSMIASGALNRPIIIPRGFSMGLAQCGPGQVIEFEPQPEPMPTIHEEAVKHANAIIAELNKEGEK